MLGDRSRRTQAFARRHVDDHRGPGFIGRDIFRDACAGSRRAGVVGDPEKRALKRKPLIFRRQITCGGRKCEQVRLAERFAQDVGRFAAAGDA